MTITLGNAMKLGYNQMLVGNCFKQKASEDVLLEPTGEDFTDELFNQNVVCIEALGDNLIFWVSVAPEDYEKYGAYEFMSYCQYRLDTILKK